jgi:hypothetical protein
MNHLAYGCFNGGQLFDIGIHFENSSRQKATTH